MVDLVSVFLTTCFCISSWYVFILSLSLPIKG
jgi:hypothetical protein